MKSKYKFDMSKMKDDILSMKEPVFAVRPRVVFGLWEKEFRFRQLLRVLYLCQMPLQNI
jgi:hypothetical protein